MTRSKEQNEREGKKRSYVHTAFHFGLSVPSSGRTVELQKWCSNSCLADDLCCCRCYMHPVTEDDSNRIFFWFRWRWSRDEEKEKPEQEGKQLLLYQMAVRLEWRSISFEVHSPKKYGSRCIQWCRLVVTSENVPMVKRVSVDQLI